MPDQTDPPPERKEHDRFPFLVTPRREKKLDAIIDGSLWRQRLGEGTQKFGIYVAIIFGTFLAAGDRIKEWLVSWLSGGGSP